MLRLPLVREFHVDLGFDLESGIAPRAAAQGSCPPLSPAEEKLVAASVRGLPLVATPYAALAARLGWSEREVIGLFEKMLADGRIRRIGAVIRHRRLGYTANAMVVWDVADERVEELGRQLGAQPSVTLCYRRPRVLPEWPYNLFSMVHGRNRQAVLAEIERLRAELGLQDIPCHPLFSLRRFKQCGARYAGFARAA